MDLNLVALAGTLAAEPELRVFPSGSSLVRYLVTVRSDAPKRRIDVIPVVLWDPAKEVIDEPGERGERVWCIGALQRRFWSADGGKHSRVEMVAHAVQRQDDDPKDVDPGERHSAA